MSPSCWTAFLKEQPIPGARPSLVMGKHSGSASPVCIKWLSLTWSISTGCWQAKDQSLGMTWLET